jgi:hypothetical protein
MQLVSVLKWTGRPIPYGKTTLVISVFAAYWLLYWAAITASPLGRDIDFNGDGNISLMEALDAGELHTISVSVNGQQCTEYVTPKDARTWRVLCPK